MYAMAVNYALIEMLPAAAVVVHERTLMGVGV